MNSQNNTKNQAAEPTNTEPKLVTDADVEQLIKTHKVVFIDCWAPWCGPCRQMAPMIDRLAKEYAKKAIIAKLDIDKNPNFASKHGIKSIPTLLFFNNGEKVDEIVGAQNDITAIRAKLDGLIAQ